MWRCVLAPDADRGSEDVPIDELGARMERLRSHAAASTSLGSTSASPNPAQGSAVLCYARSSPFTVWVNHYWRHMEQLHECRSIICYIICKTVRKEHGRRTDSASLLRAFACGSARLFGCHATVNAGGYTAPH